MIVVGVWVITTVRGVQNKGHIDEEKLIKYSEDLTVHYAKRVAVALTTLPLASNDVVA